jgi:hypothetical protein
MAGTVTISSNSDSQSFTHIVGKQVRSVLRDATLREIFAFPTTNPTVEVSTRGGDFKTVPQTYVLRAGDELRISRESGEKGNN